MIDLFEKALNSAGYGGVVLLMFIENIFPAIPSEVVMPFCGFVAARGDLGLPGVIAASVLGSMIGQMPWYYGGRWLGRRRVESLTERYGRWVTVTPHELQRVFAWFDRHGRKSVFFGRMIPAIRAVISLPAGVANMPLGTFLMFSVVGTTIWMGGLAYAGYVLGHNYEEVARYTKPLTKLVVAAVVTIYFVRLGLSFRKPKAR